MPTPIFKLDAALATHRMERRVRFVETDFTGFVMLPAYIRMMEETEYSFLRSRGLSVVLTDEKGIMGFPRLSARIGIENPVRFGDQVFISLALLEADGKKIVYEFIIENETKMLVASGRFEVACCRFPSGSPPYAILTPEFVLKKLEGGKIEKTPAAG